MLLARLLEPGAFGLVGMLSLFMAVAGVFSDSGLSASLIQRKIITPDDETSVFAVNVAIGVFLAGLLCAISPLVADFYRQPVLTHMLRLQSLSLVISSFCIVQGALMSRQMMFRETARIGLASTVASGVTGLAMAVLGFGVWSLLGSGIAGNLVRAILLWATNSWRPRGAVRLECVRSVWRFSANLLYCQLLGVVQPSVYSMIVGKLYAVESVGFFDRANNLRVLPATTFSGIVSRVALPEFSKHQDDKAVLLQRLRELVRIILLLSAGLLTFMAASADAFIPLLMTEKWSPTIPLFRILSLAGYLYPVHVLHLMSLQAQGHSHLNVRVETLKALVLATAVIAAHSFGVSGLAWSMVVVVLIAYFINVWYNVKLLNYQWRMQAFDILPPLALCACAGVLCWWVGTVIPGGRLAALAGQAVVYVTLMLAGIFALRNVVFFDAWRHGGWALGRLSHRAVSA